MCNLRKCIGLVCVVMLLALAFDVAFAAKIKKKDGETVEGKISGLIIQKGIDTTTNTVAYSVINGEYIESIDEAGMHLRDGSKFLYLLTRQKEPSGKSENEAEIVGVASRFFGGMGENSGIAGNIGVGGGVNGKYVDGKELTAKNSLIGTHRLEQKKDTIVRVLEILTASGTITIPVDEIITFKN